jgi:hypothetical protein
MLRNRLGISGAEGARTASILNLLAGIWLIITPFWMGYWVAPGPLWNNLIVGIVVAVLALIRAFAPAENVVLSWINLILGLWLIMSPFFLPYQWFIVAVHNDMFTGLVISILSLWSALATPGYARYSR